MAGRPLLLLWDIDGTLLQRATAEHTRALRQAGARVHGLGPLDGQALEYAGRTDAAILPTSCGTRGCRTRRSTSERRAC